MNQRDPEEQVERSVLSQHLQDQRCTTKPLDIQVPNIYIIEKGTEKVRKYHKSLKPNVWANFTQHGGSSWIWKRGEREPLNQNFNWNFYPT